MDDIELMKLAAKAAGMKVQYSENFGDLSIGEPYSRNERRWNPLENDGDALRLATALRLHVLINDDCVIVSPSGKRPVSVETCTPENVRLAIVRTAASMGELV